MESDYEPNHFSTVMNSTIAMLVPFHLMKMMTTTKTVQTYLKVIKMMMRMMTRWIVTPKFPIQRMNQNPNE